MNELRNILVDKRPFAAFNICCRECGEELFTMDEYIDENIQLTEALILYKLNSHTRETCHVAIEGKIEPIDTLKAIDATITVNP